MKQVCHPVEGTVLGLAYRAKTLNIQFFTAFPVPVWLFITPYWQICADTQIYNLNKIPDGWTFQSFSALQTAAK
jgi:hypothetical protein